MEENNVTVDIIAAAPELALEQDPQAAYASVVRILQQQDTSVIYVVEEPPVESVILDGNGIAWQRINMQHTGEFPVREWCEAGGDRVTWNGLLPYGPLRLLYSPPL